MNKGELRNFLVNLEASALEKFDSRRNDFMADSNIDSSQAIDLDDQSHLSESADLAEGLDQQLHAHEMILSQIKKTDFGPTDVVGPGAVVDVNGMHLVITASIPPFEFKGNKYVGVSLEAPVYKAMEGKKKGDEYELNGKKFKIEGVY